MASYEDVKEERHTRFTSILKTWIGCLGSLTVSLVGGLCLAWWEFNYHRTNDQQWMVPLGLILFATPVFIWFAVFITEFCNSNEPYIATKNSPDTLPDNPFRDLER